MEDPLGFFSHPWLLWKWNQLSSCRGWIAPWCWSWVWVWIWTLYPSFDLPHHSPQLFSSNHHHCDDNCNYDDHAYPSPGSQVPCFLVVLLHMIRVKLIPLKVWSFYSFWSSSVLMFCSTQRPSPKTADLFQFQRFCLKISRLWAIMVLKTYFM